MSPTRALAWVVERFPRLATAWRTRMGRAFRRFPSILSVELTNSCNAACVMCPRQQMRRPIGFMSVELYGKILREAAGQAAGLRIFQPFLFGESLLHPQFDQLIRQTRGALPRTRIYLSTNGALLDHRRALAILDAGVDKLNVDIDGLTPEVAESIRRRVDLGTVKENVHRFLAMRRERQGRTLLRVSIIRMVRNEGEIPAFRAYWEKFADQVQVVDFNTWLGAMDDGQAAVEDGGPAFDFPCRHPFEELAIAWDGRATLCCLDYDLRHPVGDARRQPLAQIWRGEPLEEARRALESGAYQELPICRRCNAARFQRNSLWRHLWQAPQAAGSGARPPQG